MIVASCSSGGGTDASNPSPSLELGEPVRLDLGDRHGVGVVTLGQDRVAFPFSSDRTGGRNAVVTVDLKTRERSVVAKSEFSDGTVNFVAVSGDWTVYDDQEHMRGDGEMDTLWRIVAVNGKTHERRILSTSGNKKDPFVPYVKSHDGYVYWAVAEPDQSARLLIWRPEWAEPRTVLRHADASILDLRVAGDWMVYLEPAADQQDKDGSDCWRVPLRGGKPEVLTRSGLVMDCATDDDHVVWTDHIDPKVDSPPDGEIFDDPYKLIAQRTGQEPVVLHQGYLSSSFIELFGPYVVWNDSNDGTVITRIDDPADQRVIEGDTAIDPFFSEAGRLGLAHDLDGRTVADLYDLIPR